MTPPPSSWHPLKARKVSFLGLWWTVVTYTCNISLLLQSKYSLHCLWIHRKQADLWPGTETNKYYNSRIILETCVYSDWHKTVITMRVASMIHIVTVAGLFHWQYSIHILCTMRNKSVVWIKFRKETHSPLLHNFNSTSHQSTETLILCPSSNITLFSYNFDKLISALTTTMYDVMHFSILFMGQLKTLWTQSPKFKSMTIPQT